MGTEIFLEILNPRGETELLCRERAPRIPDLKGKTIGLIDNKKSGARDFLYVIRSFLEKDFYGIRFLDLSKDYGEKHRIVDFEDKLRSIDAAIYSTGD